jgi:general secretion pathway protein G
MSRSRRRRPGGFTLVEVLLVLVILTIIGSLVVYNYGRIQSSAYEKAAETQIKAFRGPLDMYRMDVGDYPSTSQGLEALRVAPGDIANPDDWAGSYIGKNVPADPWKRDYQYEYPGQQDPSTPDIWSFGLDQTDGTEDDIVSWEEG